ncbi:MAG: histidine triad nucleotide-binding protein [Candidatus Paceibacterales bacterium]
MKNCIFCKIANEKASAEIVHKDERFIAFKDINPKAPLHLLIVPKKHIPSVNHLGDQDRELIGELFLLAQKIARDQGVAENGYKLVFNVGKGGGQLIDHLHLHLLAGWKSAEERDVPGMP